MANQLLIKNGRVIDPANHIDKTCDVLIADGKVAEVGNLNEAVETTVARVIDATGKLVTPGLIDIHVHFRDPGDEEEETIASGSTAAVAAGFTSVVCMPSDTSSPLAAMPSMEWNSSTTTPATPGS